MTTPPSATTHRPPARTTANPGSRASAGTNRPPARAAANPGSRASAGTNRPPARAVANPPSRASAGTNRPPARAVANPGRIAINHSPARDVANPDGSRPTWGPNPKFNMIAYIMFCTGIGINCSYCKSIVIANTNNNYTLLVKHCYLIQPRELVRVTPCFMIQ